MGIVTHHQRHAVIVDSLSKKTGLFLTEKGYWGHVIQIPTVGWQEKMIACLCICMFVPSMSLAAHTDPGCIFRC